MADKPTILVYDRERELPFIPSRDHDYDPAWDYEVAAPPAGEQLVSFRRVVDEVADKMLPVLGIQAVVVFFVETGSLEEDLARYVNGTSSCPMIAVDIESLRQACIVHGLGFEDQLHATLAHELAHSRLEAMTTEDTHDIDEMEEEHVVEDFARDWVESRQVSCGMLDAFADNCCITRAEDSPAAS